MPRPGRARCPATKRPPEPRTRHSLAKVLAAGCALHFPAIWKAHNLQASEPPRLAEIHSQAGEVLQASATATLGAVELHARNCSVKTCWEAELREAKRRRVRTAEEKQLQAACEEIGVLQCEEENPFGFLEDFDDAPITAQAPLRQGARKRERGQQSVGERDSAKA